MVRTPESIRREPEVGPISGEITIVNEVSGYTRGNAVSQALGEPEGAIGRSSIVEGFYDSIGLMERWIRRMNGIEGVGSAVVSPFDQNGDTFELNPDGYLATGGEPVTVPGDQISLVIPGQAREDGISPNEVMALTRVLRSTSAKYEFLMVCMTWISAS